MAGCAPAAVGSGCDEETLKARVGVFGGTFDPVHVGHLAIALAALESVPLDRVLFVPARRSPLKDRDPLASEADRVAMVEAAIAGEPRFALSRVDLHREGHPVGRGSLRGRSPISSSKRRATRRPRTFWC